MNWRIGAIVTMAVGAGVAIGKCDPMGSDPKRHAAVEMLRDQYLIDTAKALEPVKKRYRTKLESLRKEFMRKGELEGAEAAKVEMDSLDVGLANTGIVGDWLVTYSNGAKRSYRVQSNGTVRFVEEGTTCTPTLVRDGWILDFDDGKFEHIAVHPSLEVKHYESKAAALSGGNPTIRGTAVRTR